MLRLVKWKQLHRWQEWLLLIATFRTWAGERTLRVVLDHKEVRCIDKCAVTESGSYRLSHANATVVFGLRTTQSLAEPPAMKHSNSTTVDTEMQSKNHSPHNYVHFEVLSRSDKDHNT